MATKEILICSTTDHQQEIASLSENKERPETTTLSTNFVVGISRTETEYSNLNLGNVNGWINVLTKKSVSPDREG